MSFVPAFGAVGDFITVGIIIKDLIKIFIGKRSSPTSAPLSF